MLPELLISAKIKFHLRFFKDVNYFGLTYCINAARILFNRRQVKHENIAYPTFDF